MLACPLGIDTGKFVKSLRARQHAARAERVALRLAERWAAVERDRPPRLALGERARGRRVAIRRRESRGAARA